MIAGAISLSAVEKRWSTITFAETKIIIFGINVRKRRLLRAKGDGCMAAPAIRAQRVCPFFCFAKRKDQRKGDFFPKAPPEKRGPKLLMHRATRPGGLYCFSS